MIKLSFKMPKFKKLKPAEILEAGKILLEDMKQTVPVDTGRLQKDLAIKRTSSGFDIYIRTRRSNEVAGFLVEGTKAHMVRPKKAGGVLAWVGAGGKTHFSKGHVVRGIRKGYWNFRPRARAMQQFESRINKFIKANTIK